MALISSIYDHFSLGGGGGGGGEGVDGRTDKQAQTNLPLQLLRSRGRNNG